jgi:hypothetical protein
MREFKMQTDKSLSRSVTEMGYCFSTTPDMAKKNKTIFLFVQWHCREPSSWVVWHNGRQYYDLYLESARSRDLEHLV